MTKLANALVVPAIGLFMMWVAVLYLSGFATSSAAPAQYFVRGETYLFVWDCISASLIQPPANPCYTERLTVSVINEDGTLIVFDPDDVEQRGKDATAWRVNPLRAVSIAVDKNKNRRQL